MPSRELDIKKIIHVFVTSILLALVTSWILYRGFFGAPQITVRNRTSSELTDIVLSDRKLSHRFPNIGPHQSVALLVHPKGEAGLKIFFRTPDREVFKDDLAYVEERGGYCVTVTINEDLSITSQDTGYCFSLRRVL